MKPKGQTEVIKNNPSRATIIFNDVSNKRKKIMSEFYDNVDNNKLYFEYVGPTKGVRFYEYMGSNKLKDNCIRFSDALKKQ